MGEDTEPKRGLVKSFRLEWRKKGIRRDVSLSGDFSERELIVVLADFLKSDRPNAGWLEGYAEGKRAEENEMQLKAALSTKKGGKK